MEKRKIVAIVGVAMITPALLLCAFGLSGLEVPKVFDSPFIILGGLALALAINLPLAAYGNIRFEGGNFVGSVTLDLKNSMMNLGVIALIFILLATITLYLFLENFQPR